MTKLRQQLQTIPHVHVVCEATGGYERPLVQALHQAQIPVSVANPAQVRAAAQAQGQRAKTDRIDAALLTDFGQRFQPKPTPPTSPSQDQLVALTQWLTQLIQAQALARTQASTFATNSASPLPPSLMPRVWDRASSGWQPAGPQP